LISLINELQK
jgi:cytochrome P450